jgi:hypothetical protein
VGKQIDKGGCGYVLHAPDRAVKASGSEAKTLSDVLEEQITFDLSFERNLWASRSTPL